LAIGPYLVWETRGDKHRHTRFEANLLPFTKDSPLARQGVEDLLLGVMGMGQSQGAPRKVGQA
jgi:hypothetical protein